MIYLYLDHLFISLGLDVLVRVGLGAAVSYSSAKGRVVLAYQAFVTVIHILRFASWASLAIQAWDDIGQIMEHPSILDDPSSMGYVINLGLVITIIVHLIISIDALSIFELLQLTFV